MFREDTSHLQNSFFDIYRQLPASKKKKMEESEENSFYNLVFCRIKEKDFKCLYSEKGSRPNTPVNRLVAAIIWMWKKGWSVKELITQTNFNLLTRQAIGLKKIDEEAFCETTYFNFQNRIREYFVETGVNLLEEVFDGLTEGQCRELKIKTNIQRTDSFQAMSNIRSYSRLQLLIEVLLRIYREIKKEDKEKFKDALLAYTGKSSGQYVYKLNRNDIPHELDKLGKIYHKLHTELKEDYGDLQIFQILERVYEEHFTVLDEKIEVKPNEELHSGMLQSPDDMEATYRKKREEEYRGQVVNVTETANPENEVELLTDIGGYSNNTDDDEILNDRIDKITEKTPDMEELHTDGGYGSEKTDEKMEEKEIRQVQTDIRGRKSEKVPVKITQIREDKYEAECPQQKVKSQKTRKRHKACFDKEICKSCEYSSECPSVEQKSCRVYYFTHNTYLLDKRRRVLDTLPPERRKLRPNIEATVKEFTGPLNHKGKLRVRGRFKTMMYAYSMAIAINFGRIHRYLVENPKKAGALGINSKLFFGLKKIFEKIRKNIFRKGIFLKNQKLFAGQRLIG